jgi:hypothetical protein
MSALCITVGLLVGFAFILGTLNGLHEGRKR